MLPLECPRDRIVSSPQLWHFRVTEFARCDLNAQETKFAQPFDNPVDFGRLDSAPKNTFLHFIHLEGRT